MSTTKQQDKPTVESIGEFEKRYLPTLLGTSEEQGATQKGRTKSFGSLLASDLTDNIRESLKKALED